jgi:hypothetical protein
MTIERTELANQEFATIVSQHPMELLAQEMYLAVTKGDEDMIERIKRVMWEKQTWRNQ